MLTKCSDLFSLQTVIFTTNKWTFDATVFNPIRDKRPLVKANVTDTQ